MVGLLNHCQSMVLNAKNNNIIRPFTYISFPEPMVMGCSTAQERSYSRFIWPECCTHHHIYIGLSDGVVLAIARTDRPSGSVFGDGALCRA